MSGRKAKAQRRANLHSRAHKIPPRPLGERVRVRGSVLAAAGLVTGALTPMPAWALWENLTNVSGSATLTTTSPTSQQVAVQKDRKSVV